MGRLRPPSRVHQGPPRGGLCPSLRCLPPPARRGDRPLGGVGWLGGAQCRHHRGSAAGFHRLLRPRAVHEGSQGGVLHPPMNLSQLKRYAKGDPYRLIPRCVITQASGKQRLIDDATRGGRSASSRDSNKLVLCTPLRPALHVQAAAACLQECAWERFAQQGQWTGAGDDWPNAYRHCPMSRQEALACVVVWYHQEWQGPAFQVYHGLRGYGQAFPGNHGVHVL